MSVYLFVYLHVCLSVCLLICLCVCLSPCLSSPHPLLLSPLLFSLSPLSFPSPLPSPITISGHSSTLQKWPASWIGFLRFSRLLKIFHVLRYAVSVCVSLSVWVGGCVWSVCMECVKVCCLCVCGWVYCVGVGVCVGGCACTE